MGNNDNGGAAPANDERRIVIIGAGPGGISSGYYLREAGYTNFTIFERAGEVGGTWQRNRYPGLACDVWSHVYSFTFALNPAWTRSYAAQPEILEYMRKTVTDLDLWPHIRLNTGIASAAWDDATGTWVVTTDSGEEVVADVVISGQGMFGELKYPAIEGRDSFEGVAMHTGAWDESVELEGKRVAVIGSAASAVQSIPEIAKAAGQLTVFQRSANWVLPKEDVEHTPEQLDEFHADPDALQEYHNGIMAFVGPSTPFSNPDDQRRRRVGRGSGHRAGRGPRGASQAHPHHPLGLHAPAVLEPLLPDLQPAQRGAGDRPDRAHHPHGHRHR